MNTHNLTRIIKNGEREITNYTLISSNRLKEQKKKKGSTFVVAKN